MMVAESVSANQNSFMRTIYLDHNATTPTRPEVVEAMARRYAEGYANPASQHLSGQRARQVLEDLRERIATLLGADLSCPQPDCLIFTSGGTEANNLALLGIAQARGTGPGQIVISAIEHPCVIEPAEHLLERGWRVDTLGVNPHGVLRLEDLPGLISPETRLVSLILGSHETGVIQPVAEAVQLCRPDGVPVHTDAVQAVGKCPVNFRQLGVSAMSITAHKFRGPPGIGALIFRHEVPISPLLFGGHQQNGLRPGTESIPLAAGMLTALELGQQEQSDSWRRLVRLRLRFEECLKREWPQIIIHGEDANRLPQTSNIAFPGVDGQMLLIALDIAGVACSMGSACASGSTEPTPTLRAMGLPNEVVRSSLRFSLGANTSEKEIELAVGVISRVYRQLLGQS
jgi:cysteine desulfurase